MNTGKAQGRPRVIQPIKRNGAHKSGCNRNALFDITSQRRQFIRAIKDYGPHYIELDVTGAQEPCSFSPPCRNMAVVARKYATHIEYLCKTEIEELRK